MSDPIHELIACIDRVELYQEECRSKRFEWLHVGASITRSIASYRVGETHDDEITRE